MTLRELRDELEEEELKRCPPDAPVKFHTKDRYDMELLSIYETDGVLNIDIGNDGD